MNLIFSYNWIDEKSPENKIGLIAQEVKKIIPEVVTGNELKENQTVVGVGIF